jgi:monofunctional biosynthetic peptidoglycan transglycosylase
MKLRRPKAGWLRRIVIRILLVMAVFWGGGIALFSFLPVPFSAVMVERQVSNWLSGNFSYVAHSDWVSMDEISPWMGAGRDCRRRSKIPSALGV